MNLPALILVVALIQTWQMMVVTAWVVLACGVFVLWSLRYRLEYNLRLWIMRWRFVKLQRRIGREIMPILKELAESLERENHA